jgi:hypothetical protein
MGVAVGALVPQVGLAHEDGAAGDDHISTPWDPAREATLPLLALPRVPVAAQSTSLVASLTVGQEVPRPAIAGVGASGRLRATLSGRILHWRLTFVHLSGPVTAGVIHRGARGHVGPRIARICGRCTSPRSGVLYLTQAQATDMRAGRTYVNVATTRNPHGEIRGQIRRLVYVAPPPGHYSHASHVSHASHASHASHSSHVSSA